MLIFNISFGVTVSNLDKKMIASKFSSEIDFKDVALADALSVLSKSTGITMVADTLSRLEPLDLYIGKGKNLKEVVDTLKVANNLKTKLVGDIIVFSKRNWNSEGDNTVVGKVTSKEFENGIDGVTITLLNTGLNSIITQYKGIFIMENVNPGIYILRAKKEGYEIAGELVEVKGNQNNYLEIELLKENMEGQLGIVSNGSSENVKSLGQTKTEGGEEFTSERIILKHAFPEDVKDVLESVLGEVEVSAFEKLNMIIIKGTEQNVIPARKLVEDLDVPQKQVRITAQILDVTDNLFEELGFDWYYNDNGQLPTGETEGIGGSFLDDGLIGLGNRYKTAFDLLKTFNGGEDVLGVAVEMLQTTQDLAISAVPSIVIMNGEEAEFKITDEVIVGEEEVEEDDDITRTSPLFEEAGLVFKVTPTVRDGLGEAETILLEVDTELSNFNLSNVGTFNENGGSKSARNILTTVSVKSGESLFIGGLKRAEVRNLTSKVPLLGDIPGLGFMFRNEVATNEMRDIFIKIKAEIVTEENSQSSIELDGFEQTELHRMERDVRDYRRIYPKVPTSYQLLGTPNTYDD